MVGAVIGLSVPEFRLGRVEQPADPDRSNRSCQPSGVDVSRDPAQRRRTQRRLEPARGNAAGEAPKGLILLHADHRIIVARHADVGDEASAAGENTMIRAWHMRMGADDEARPPVGEVAKRRFSLVASA